MTKAPDEYPVLEWNHNWVGEFRDAHDDGNRDVGKTWLWDGFVAGIGLVLGETVEDTGFHTQYI